VSREDIILSTDALLNDAPRRRSAYKELRDLDIGFYGGGFPNVPIECGIQQLNKLLMHYGCPSSVGVQLQSSMELFLIELGRAH